MRVKFVDMTNQLPNNFLRKNITVELLPALPPGEHKRLCLFHLYRRQTKQFPLIISLPLQQQHLLFAYICLGLLPFIKMSLCQTHMFISSLFWDVTQIRLVLSYRRFGPISKGHQSNMNSEISFTSREKLEITHVLYPTFLCTIHQQTVCCRLLYCL
jgi:hypothetical protein